MKISKKEYDITSKKVMTYIIKHPGCYSLDIGVKLKLRPELVLKILTQLKYDNKIMIGND